MQKNIRWETIIWLVIIITLISIALLSLFKILEYDKKLDLDYKKINYISILETNTYNIIKKINTTNLKENDIFFLEKSWNEINLLTWSLNENYKYISNEWENVLDLKNFKWPIYSRFCIVEKDSESWQNIKCSIREMIKK